MMVSIWWVGLGALAAFFAGFGMASAFAVCGFGERRAEQFENVRQMQKRIPPS